jgi:hypothetical protein
VDNFEIGECFTNCLVKRGYSSGFGLFELGEFGAYFSQLDPDKMGIVYLCVDLSMIGLGNVMSVSLPQVYDSKDNCCFSMFCFIILALVFCFSAYVSKQ